MCFTIEVLEQRIAPAGVVNVSFKGGLLTIFGDAGNNKVSLAPGANFGELSITGSDGETFVLNGAAPAASITIGPGLTKTAVVKLGVGDDSFTVNGAVIPTGLDLQLGAGADDVVLTDTSIGGNLKIVGDLGTDEVLIDGGVFRLGGSLSFLTGAGTADLSIKALETRILGNLQYTGDKLPATANFGDTGTSVSIGGSALIKSGVGGGGNFKAEGDLLWVGGNFTLDRAGGGAQTSDGFSTTEIMIGGAMKIKYIGGLRVFGVSSSDTALFSALKGLEVTAAAGGGYSLNIAPDRAVLGKVQVALPVTSFFSIIAGADDGLNIQGPVTVTAGEIGLVGDGFIAGAVKTKAVKTTIGASTNDTLHLAGAVTSTILSSPTDPSEFTFVRAEQQGALTLTGSAVVDTVKIEDVTVLGAIKMSLGAGNDSVSFDNSTLFTGASRFFGAVSVNLGAGDDGLGMAGPNAETVASFYNTVKITRGGGTDGIFTANAVFAIPPVVV